MGLNEEEWQREKERYFADVQDFMRKRLQSQGSASESPPQVTHVQPKQTWGLASVADPNALYVQCVNAPVDDLQFYLRVWQQLRPGTSPLLLREDFCGSAALCCEWVKSDPHRVAYGVDLDEATLIWGQENHVDTLDAKGSQMRVHLLQQNVLRCDRCIPKADLIVANNYSHFVFKTREQMIAYFTSVSLSLSPSGVFISDLYGGPEAQTVGVEDVETYRFVRTDNKETEWYTYQWEQYKYNPITHETITKIQFRFPDGSSLRDLYVYDWRLWNAPELLEMLREAGFMHARLYMEQFDERTNESTGEYREQALEEFAQHTGDFWRAYIVATLD